MVLAIAGLVSLPFALTGCNSSSGGSGGDGGDGDVTPTPPSAAAFKVDFTDGAPAVNWGETVVVKAFRPAQASYEYLQSPSHPGAPMLAMGCTACHGSDPGRPPHTAAKHDEEDPVHDIQPVDVSVAAAYDANNFYLKASWQSERPGLNHGIQTFKNGVWGGGSVAREPGNDPAAEGKVFSAEDRFGAMFMPASIDTNPAGPSFHKAGCFVTCHSDMADMPEWISDEKDTLKYLVTSQPLSAEAADLASLHPAKYATGADTDAQVKSGAVTGFPDMWHWRGGRSAAVQGATDGYVMQTRASDAGANTYGNNSDANGVPLWMFDPTWMAAWITKNFPGYTGSKNVSAFPAALWDQAKGNAPSLVRNGPNANAVAFAATSFQEGDILPLHYQQVSVDSRNDVKVYSSWADGAWTVIFKRARDTGNKDDHVLNPAAENYTFGFAVHQDHTQHRWHHVTYPVTLGMEGSNAVIRAKLN